MLKETSEERRFCDMAMTLILMAVVSNERIIAFMNLHFAVCIE